MDQQEFRIFMDNDGYDWQQEVESHLSRSADTTDDGEVIFGDMFWDKAVRDVESWLEDWLGEYGHDISDVDVDEWCRELFPDGVEE